MNPIGRLLLPLALAAAPLIAQDAHFAIQAGVSSPKSDLSDYVDGSHGLTLGVNMPIDFGSGQVIRPRLDYSYYRKTDFVGDINRVKSIYLGADYLYFLAQKMEGLYLTAGIGAQNTKIEHDDTLAYYDFTNSKTAFAWNAGVGWQFTNLLGTEVRYTSSHPEFFKGYHFKADAITLGVTFKF